MFAFPLAFEAIPERLAVTLAAATVVFEQATAFLRQRHGMLSRAGHPNGLDQAQLAKMPQVTGARIG